MSNNEDDNGNGFRNSRIDLSRLGEDNWNNPYKAKPAAKPATANPATAKPAAGRPAVAPQRRRPVVATPPTGARQATLEELFESRVHAATAKRTVKQNRGQSRVWMFAGGLFLASVGGIAAAYYLIGPPMVSSAYLVDDSTSQTASLEVSEKPDGTASSHFQSVTLQATMSAAAPEITNEATQASSQQPVVMAPPADGQGVGESALREPVVPAAPVAPQQQIEAAAVETQEAEPTAALATEATDKPVSERMVRIVPTAVSEEPKVTTNVNTAKAPSESESEIGQWLAVPAETEEPAVAPSVETAAATPQSTNTNPAAGPIKTQQELFKEFQEYLEISGQAGALDEPAKEALFNKFMSWSVEAPKEN